MARVLVLHPGALGDVLLALPALQHLRGTLPGAHLVLAASPRIGRLLQAAGLVEEARDLEGLGLQGLFVEPPDPEALRRLAAYDVVVSWYGAGDATYRGSLARLGRPHVIARAVPPGEDRRHASRHLLETLAPLVPIPADTPTVALVPPAPARAAARAWLEARGLGPGQAVVLHPGAGNRAKVWPDFARLARALRREGWPVVVLEGPADGAAVAAVLADAGPPPLPVARDLDLVAVAALLAEVWAFVGNDSGPTHLAAVVGCRTVALFGPTDAAVWAPRGPRVRVLGGAGSLPWAALPVEAVLAALHELGSGAAGPVPTAAGSPGSAAPAREGRPAGSAAARPPNPW